MTEHRLDAAQIGAVLEEVRGETVAQFVRRGRLPNSGHARVQKDAFPESLTSQRLARWGEEEHTARCGPRVLRAVDEIDLDRRDGHVSDRNEPPFAAFSERGHHAAPAVDVGEGEFAKFADTQPSGIEHLQHRAVPSPARVPGIGRVEEPQHLLHRENLREPATELRSIDELARVLSEHALMDEIAAKASHGGKVTRGRTRPDAVPAEADEEARDGACRNFRGAEDSGRFEVLGEFGEVTRVGLDAVVRETALDTNVVEIAVDAAINRVAHAPRIGQAGQTVKIDGCAVVGPTPSDASRARLRNGATELSCRVRRVEAFEVIEPADDSPVLVEIPHAGLELDAPTMNWLVAPARSIARDADLYVDELYTDAPRLGATVLRANVSRFAVDLNRASDDFDGQTVEGGSTADRPRGVVWRLTSEGCQVQRERMPRVELERRLDRYWRPYHQALAALLERKRARFGHAVLLCAHSMPTPKVRGLRSFAQSAVADVVPGTRGRTSAAGRWIDEVDRLARDHGFSVEHDFPYRGGFSTMHYGRPDLEVHAIQLELARRLYMDEDTLVLDPRGVARVRRFTTDLIERLVTSAP